MTIGNSSDTSIAELNRLTDLPLQPTIDDFEDDDMTEYSTSAYGSVTATSSPVKQGSYAGEVSVSPGFNVGQEGNAVSTNGLDEYPDQGETFEAWIRSSGDSDTYGYLIFGAQNESYFYSANVRPDSNQLQVSRHESSGAGQNNLASSSVSLSLDTWYRLQVSWQDNGDIDVALYNSSGSEIADVSANDNTYSDGGAGLGVYGYDDDSTDRTYLDDYKVTDSGGIEIDADTDFADNQISDVKSIDGGGNAVKVEDNLDLSGNNISNFFNQTACADDEAIKTIYPNGSYSCNALSTTTEAEGLSETLEANDSANQSIDLNQNGLLDTAFISGGGEAIQINDDLDLGNNKLIFGGGNISGALEFTSDIDMQGNDLEQVGFLNPGGSSTNFGGDLNVGGDRVTGTDNLEFSRGVEIGDEDTFTGSRNVEPAENFTVDTNTEWQDNGTINNGLDISNSDLRLDVTGDSASKQWNDSLPGSGTGLSVGSSGNIYVSVGFAAPENQGNGDQSVKKYDASGNQLWSASLPSDGKDVAVDEPGVYAVTGDGNLRKFDSSGNTQWTESLTGEGAGVDIGQSGIYTVSASDIRKYDSSGNVQWTESLPDVGNDIAVGDSGIYASSRDGLRKYDSSGNVQWTKSFSGYGYGVGVGESGVYVGISNDKLRKFDSSGNLQWTESVPDSVEGISVKDSGVHVAIGSRSNSLRKFDSSGSVQWTESLSGITNDVAVEGSRIYSVYEGIDGITAFENVVSYSSSGDYNSSVFDSGSTNPFPEFRTSAFLPGNTDANVTVELSNSSDMSSSVSEKLEIGGGTESQIIDRNARYARFTVNMTGDTTDTPELDQVRIDYGNNAAAYGYNQIALGQGATTDAEGAVAIGYNASSDQAYTVRFGNEQGQEQDVEITGNLSLSDDSNISNFFNQTACADDEAIKTIYPNGSYACNSLSTTTEAENLSETLAAGNTLNDSIVLDSGTSLEIGSSTTTNDAGDVAIGRNTQTDAIYYSGVSSSPKPAIAIGKDAQVGNLQSSIIDNWPVSIGVNSYADPVGTSLGSKAMAGSEDDSVDRGATAVGYKARAKGENSVAVGRESSATKQDSISIGGFSSASAIGSVAIGPTANAPNSYEATFGNLDGEELDVNVTGNLTVHGSGGLDMRDNPVNDASKVGVGTDSPEEDLDVDGSANISSSGTSMEVESDGDVVVTLG